jgi:hypothetical protein
MQFSLPRAKHLFIRSRWEHQMQKKKNRKRKEKSENNQTAPSQLQKETSVKRSR